MSNWLRHVSGAKCPDPAGFRETAELVTLLRFRVKAIHYRFRVQIETIATKSGKHELN